MDTIFSMQFVFFGPILLNCNQFSEGSENAGPERVILTHSMLREILTFHFSRMIETLIFGLGWVVGITPNARFVQFCHYIVLYSRVEGNCSP